MGRRSKPILYMALFGSAILVAVGIGWLIAGRSAEKTEGEPTRPAYETPVLEKREVHLYFGDGQGRYLTAEQQVIDQPVDTVVFGRRILAILLAGPQQGTTPTLPPGVALRAFYIINDGTAVADFASGSFDNHPGGVESELLSIYSIVNTLVLNVEEIRSVKILIGGQEAATLAGHVELSHPFKADMLWVR